MTEGKKYQGFARMKAEDPIRFKDVCARAGRRSQKLGVGYRWDRATALKWARVGARACHKVMGHKVQK